MKIVILRHGQSVGNKKRIIQGQLDLPLTDLGKKQAEEASKILGKDYSIDVIYSSDLQRASKTAEIVANGLGIDNVILEKGFREFNLGEFQGKKNDELLAEEQAYINSCWEDPDKKIPGGESDNEMKSRIKAAFERIIDSYPEETTILIVGHGGTAYHLLKKILDVFPETDEWFTNCSINEISRKNSDDQWKLIKFNNKYLEVKK